MPAAADGPAHGVLDRAALSARTRAGSLTREWALLIHDECAARGVGLTKQDITALVDAGRFPAPASIPTTLQYLLKQGLLATSGRRGAYRYHPSGFVEGMAQRLAIRTDAEIVADALHIATGAAGCLVPSALVRFEIERRGWTLRSSLRGAVDNGLRALQGVRCERAVTVRGNVRRFFGPASRPDLQAPSPVITSVSDAALHLAQELVAVLGRPVTLPEVWLYARSLAPEHPARWFITRWASRSGRDVQWERGGRHLSPAFYNEKTQRVRERLRKQAAAGDVAAPGRERPIVLDVRQHRSHYHLAGATRTRYAVVDIAGLVAGGQSAPSAEAPSVHPRGHGGEPSEDVGVGAGDVVGADVVHLDDFLQVYEVDAEAQGLARLTAALAAEGCDTLRPWLDARAAALQDVVGEFFASAPGLTPVAPPTALAGLTRGAAPDVMPTGGRATDAAVRWLMKASEKGEAADRHLLRLAAAPYDAKPAYALQRAIQHRTAQRRRAVAVLREAITAPAAGTMRPGAPETQCPHGTAPALPGSGAAAIRIEGLIRWAAPYVGLEVAAGRKPAATPVRSALHEAPQEAFQKEGAGVAPDPAMTALRGFVCHARRFPDLDALARRAAALAARRMGRRVPTPTVHPLLDRAEALTALVDAQPDAWTTTLARRAYMLLGPIARSVDALDACLAQVGPGDQLAPGLRRRLVIAGGLLGAPGTPAAARRLVTAGAGGTDTSEAGHVDDTDVRAAALAVSLVSADALRAFLDSPEVAALPYEFAERVAKIRRRARAGMWLSVGAP
jgi:hypothetical protein